MGRRRSASTSNTFPWKFFARAILRFKEVSVFPSPPVALVMASTKGDFPWQHFRTLAARVKYSSAATDDGCLTVATRPDFLLLPFALEIDGISARTGRLLKAAKSSALR